jgi:hypothetical protein
MYRSSRSNRRVHRWLEDLPTTPEPPSSDTMSHPTVYVLTDDGHRSPSRRHSSRRSGHSSRHRRSSSVNTHSRPRRQTLHRLRTSSLVNLPQSTSPYKRYPSPDSTVSPSDSASQVGKSTYRGLQNTGYTHMVYAPSPVYPTSPVGSMSGTTVYAGSQWLQQPQSLTYSSGQPVYYVYSQPQVYTQPQTYLQPQTAFGWSVSAQTMHTGNIST